MWVSTAVLLLAAPAADVAPDAATVVGAGKSLLPQHQQLSSDAKHNSSGGKHSALWEANHAEHKTGHSALWEAKHAAPETASKVELRKTRGEEDEEPEDQQQQQQQQQQGEQGGQEGKEDESHTAINVVVSVMLFGSLTFIMSLFYLVNYPDPQIRAQAWRAVSSTIVIFVSVLVFNASNGFVSWPRQDDGDAQQDVNTRLYSPAWSLKVQEVGFAPDTGDFLLAMAQLAVWLMIFQFSVSLCAGVMFWKPEALEESPPTSPSKQLKKHMKKLAPTAGDLEIAATASAMIIGHVAGFAAINAFGTLMQLRPFAEHFGLSLLAWLITVPSVVLMVIGSEKLRDFCLKKNERRWL